MLLHKNLKNFLLSYKSSFTPYQYASLLIKQTSFFVNTQKEFSDTFLDYISFRHLTYYDDNYGQILLEFFKSYINLASNNHSLFKIEIDEETLINFLPNKSIIYYNQEQKVWQYIYIHNSGMTSSEPQIICSDPSYSILIQKLLNINSNDVYATIAKIIGISFENFYTHQSYTENNEAPTSSDIKIVSSQHLYNKNIYTFNNNILGKFITYRIKDFYFTITTNCNQDQKTQNSYILLGKSNPYAKFYNYTIIDQQQNLPILFFQNINQAFAYENILPKDYIQRDKFIITGHNSDNLEILDWSLFAYKTLIFICEPKKKAYEEINLYKHYFDKYAVNFKIFPYPLLFTELGFDCNKQSDLNNLPNTEQKLLENALYMDENFQENLNTICNDSLPWKDFISWGNKLGLFSKHQTEENYFEHTPLPITNTDTFEENIYNISLDSLFLDNSITLLHAPTETGKSILALSIVKALLNSSQFLFFKTSQKKPNILILDGETPPKVFCKRLCQLNININSNKLFPISILQEKTGKRKTLWSNMDLSNDECKNQLTMFIKANNITFIIIDNISCLALQNINTDKLPQEIFYWLHQLTETGCSVLLIHHTKEGGSRPKGSQLWSNQSPNEIQLTNVNNYKRPPKAYKELIAKYKPSEGLFCGIQFNKNKSFPVLQNKIFWVTLPINASDWKLLTITDKNANILENNLPIYEFPDLDKRENLILSNTKETFTAKDAEDIIKKKRGTVLKCLKNLQDKGYIKKEGTIKSTYYIKTINDNSASENNQPSIEATIEQAPSKPILPPHPKTTDVQKIKECRQTQTNNTPNQKSGVIVVRRQDIKKKKFR